MILKVVLFPIRAPLASLAGLREWEIQKYLSDSLGFSDSGILRETNFVVRLFSISADFISTLINIDSLEIARVPNALCWLDPFHCLTALVELRNTQLCVALYDTPNLRFSWKNRSSLFII